MQPNQDIQDQLGANNQGARAQNILKFVYYQQNDDDIKNIKSISLLNQSFNFFDYIPKNFNIITQNGSYKFNDEMLKDTSSVIFNFLANNPNATEFNIDVKDDTNIMGKIESMYNGEIVNFKENDLKDLQKIISTLNIVRCPKFMKLKSFKFQNSTLFYEIPDYTVEMDKTQFIIFLDRILPKSFTISTNNHEYKCNKLGIKSSFVIKDQLEKDPHLNSYHFNFDDEFGIFQQICNFFNFQSIEINTDNMHAIKEIANDLQINCIIDEISNIIKSYEVVVNTIDEKNFLIDPVIELCKNLCEIKSIGIEKVQEKISMSIWSTTKENVQELVCYLIQVIHNDLSLHPYIMNLITSLDKKATEENDLKILLPSFLKQIMLLFPYNKNNCAFVFRLVNKGLVSISEIINKLALAIEKNEEQKNYSYSKFSEKDKFISNLTCPFKTNPNINLIELKNAIVWFFPEVSSIKGAESIINDAKMNEFLHKYFPEK